MSGDFIGTFTIGQTLDRGIRLYRHALKKVIIIFMLPALLSGYYMMNMWSIQMQPRNANLGQIFTIPYLLMIVVGFYAWVISVRYLQHLSQGKSLEMGEIARLFKVSDLLLIVTYIIWVIMMMVGMLLLVLPGIYIMNFGAIAFIIAIIERKYFFNSVGRVFKLMKGRWWKTFAINIVTILMIGVPLYALMALGMAIGGVTAAREAASAMQGTPEVVSPLQPMLLVGSALYSIGAMFVTPLFVTINIVHYNSLRSEKESADIEQQLDGLGPNKEANETRL